MGDSDMFLTFAELIELTGRRRRDAQAKALRYMGIAHKIRPDGSVAVLRAHVDQVLGLGVSLTKSRKTAPDFSLVA